MDAVLVIRGGGVQVAPGAVLLYGVISMVASLVVTWRMRRTSDSDLVAAEAAQWKAGAWLSAVIGTGGLVALVLDGTSWDGAVPFADPVLVLIACLVITPVPFRMLRDAGLELLEAAPSPTVQHEISASVRDAQEAFGLPDPHVAATKLGDRLYLEVVFVVGEGWAVSEEDAVRHAIIDRLEPLGYDVWANVELTTDAGLVE